MRNIDFDFFPPACVLAPGLDLKSKIDVRHYYLAEGVKNQFYLLALHSHSLQWSGSNTGNTVNSHLLTNGCDASLGIHLSYLMHIFR